MPKPSKTEVLPKDAAPRDPAWDAVRDTAAQLRTMGRLMLRGQVRLGMLLAALKKEHCKHGGNRKNQVPESGTCSLNWPDLVRQETGFSRQSADVFIHLYEATKAKLKTSRKLALPKEAKKDALVLFEAKPLKLTTGQWDQVDHVISTLTDGETQASLLEELGVLPKPKPMPKGGGKTKTGNEPEATAGQLAFHFFEAVASPLINARCNPEYKKLLHVLPVESTEECKLSLTTLEAEARALLADIEEARQARAKPAKGRTL